VEEEIGIADGIHATMREHGAHVFLEFLADAERVMELLHQIGLLRGEGVGIGRIDSGEVATLHLVLLAIDGAYATLIVDSREEHAVLHLPLRTAAEDGGLLLELNHGDGLVHLGREQLGFLVHLIARQQLGHELLAGIILISLEGEGGQRHEVDAVLLDGGEVGITQRETQHIADTGIIASRSAHPQDVVIAPLDIPRVILAQGVHDDVGTRTAIVDVAKDMQLVDGQTLDDVTDGADEIIGTTGRNNGVDNDADVSGLVDIGEALVEQLLDDIRELLG